MRTAAAGAAGRLLWSSYQASGGSWLLPAAAARGSVAATTPTIAAGPTHRRPVSTSSTPADDTSSSSSSSSSDPAPPKASWLPAWARARLPAALGGEPALEDLTLDAYLTQISRARKLATLGSAIGGVGRASSDPQAQGNLRLYETIIGAMDPVHRADPSAFDAAARTAVAAKAGASVAQVDDCMAKFEWTREMMRVLAARKAAGQPMPSSVEELEAVMGDWRARRRAGGGGGGGGGGPAVSSSTAACPFEGRAAPGRNAVCAKTGKKWKNCCGKAA